MMVEHASRGDTCTRLNTLPRVNTLAKSSNSKLLYIQSVDLKGMRRQHTQTAKVPCESTTFGVTHWSEHQESAKSHSVDQISPAQLYRVP